MTKGEKITVSVFMITYNHEGYIAQALDSILMQKTNFKYEIVIGEDCSTDATRKIILKYAKKHPGIFQLLLHKTNIGMMPNIIATLKACGGKYIALCEGDDYWTDPLKLQKQVDFLEGAVGYSGCFHDCKIVVDQEKEGYLRVGIRVIEKNVTLISLINENNIATASIVFKNFLQDIPNYWSKTIKGDYAIMIAVAEQGLIKYLPEVMSVYRVHEGGIWSSKSQIYHEKEGIKFCDLLMSEYCENSEIVETLKIKIKHSYFRMSIVLVREKERLKSLCYLLQSLPIISKQHNSTNYFKYFKEFIKSFKY